VANAKSRINQIFALFLFSGVIWGFFIGLWGLNISSYQEYLFGTIATIFGIFPATISYFFFGLVFLRKPFKLWLLYTIPTYLFFSYLAITEAIVSYAEKPFAEGFGVHQRAAEGAFFMLAIVWGASLIAILITYLIKELFKKGADKTHLLKVKLLLIDTVLVSSLVVVYNANPGFWGIPLDMVGMLAAAVILTYGILRFELVDVNVRLRNTLVNIIFAVFLTGAYSLLIVLIRFIVPYRFDTYIWWPAIVAAIYLTSISLPLRDRILRFVDIAFYQTRYDYRETISKFASQVGEILELKSLSDFITATIKQTFGAESTHLFVLLKGRYEAFNCSGECYLEKKDPITNFLVKNERPISEEEINESLLDHKKMEHLKPKVIVPLNSGDDLVGALFVGQRVSGDFYSGEDKNLLYTLGQASAIALKNSSLYQEVLENEKEIEKLLSHERDVNESKNEFVNIVSHYLRTPLTSIKGYLDMLLRDRLSSVEKSDYLTRAYNEQKRLSSLVEDLISISSLEKGKLHLFKKSLSLSEVIEKVVDDFSSLAQEKNLYLKTATKGNLGTINADSQKIIQAISNLVDNAIKFTKIGGITIKAVKKDSRVEICVEDTGVGVDEQEIPKLFQKFHRGTSVKTFTYEGSGLGLYITKLIIETHGGEIKASSELGKGSRFCIYLPLKL
jgi:signal transduction histidine kinase